MQKLGLPSARPRSLARVHRRNETRGSGIERILFLESIPNVAASDKISVGPSVRQQLENDRGLEQAALTVLKPGIRTCLEVQDDASRELLEDFVVDEERHIDWIETQLH